MMLNISDILAFLPPFVQRFPTLLLCKTIRGGALRPKRDMLFAHALRRASSNDDEKSWLSIM